ASLCSGLTPRRSKSFGATVRKAYGGRACSTERHALMKGVGKFGEVMAGEKGKVSYDEVAARLEKIIHSGSQRKPITDFVCRELRKIPHYTWVGIYNVDGSELALASWSGPSATLHLRIPVGQGICGAAVAEKATVVVPDVTAERRSIRSGGGGSEAVMSPATDFGATTRYPRSTGLACSIRPATCIFFR